MTVIPFQTKQTEHKRTPVEALNYVIEKIESGDTLPESMVISWNERSEDDTYQLRYMVAGNVSLASVLGMIDLTKAGLMERT
jgi:hypothetical protein